MLRVKASLVLTIAMAAISSLSTVSLAPKSPVSPEKVEGHFTRKDKIETMWLTPPKLNAEETGCVGDRCTATINFSDPNIPVIPINGCIGGTPTNLGDLDNDGLDEIGLLPEWFTSCWRDYRVYTFKRGKWIPAVTPFPTHCNQWEENLQPIIKDPAVRGECNHHLQCV
jgi:hypothetical protein